MSIKEQIKTLKERHMMDIPIEYEEFIKETSFFDYVDSIVTVGSIEVELNHFLKEDDENPSRDLLSWYSYARDERIEYLTIAMGYGNEEFAIKIKGKDVGGVYCIIQNEDVTIEKICNDFNEFKKFLTKEN